MKRVFTVSVRKEGGVVRGAGHWILTWPVRANRFDAALGPICVRRWRSTSIHPGPYGPCPQFAPA